MDQRVTSKHFEVKRPIPLKGHIEALVPGMKIVLIGHGWVNPAPGVFLHPFEVWNGEEDLGEIDLGHAQLTNLVESGALLPLP